MLNSVILVANGNKLLFMYTLDHMPTLDDIFRNLEQRYSVVTPDIARDIRSFLEYRFILDGTEQQGLKVAKLWSIEEKEIALRKHSPCAMVSIDHISRVVTATSSNHKRVQCLIS